MSDKPQAIVVGAGISGLTAAHRLQQAGFSVRTLEAEAEIGGRMSSVEIGGFCMNRGASVLPMAYANIRELAVELGFGEQLRRLDGVIGIVREGEVHRMRTDHLGLDGLRTELLSRGAKLRLFKLAIDAARIAPKLTAEHLGPAAPFDTETALEYARRRLGQELEHYLVNPVVRGMATDASVVEYFVASTSTLGSGFMAYPGGVDFLVRALAARLEVETGARVVEVGVSDGRVHVSWEQGGGSQHAEVDACVLAVPGPLVPALYPGLDARARAILRDELEYGTTFVAHLGLSRRPSEPAMVVLLPEREHPGLYSVAFDHHLRPELVPPGKGQLTAYFLHEWSQARSELDDEALLDEMLPAIAPLVPGLRESVELSRVDRWTHAAMRGRPGYCSAIAELVERLDPSSPIQLAGDYFHSSSTNACVASAERAAARLRERLSPSMSR